MVTPPLGKRCYRKKVLVRRVLRLLSGCFILVGSAMFGAIFSLVTRVGLPWFSEHWKIVAWKLISYPSSNCFSYRNVLKNSVNALSKIDLKIFVVLLKNSNFVHFFWTIRFGLNFASMWSNYVSNNVWKNYRLLESTTVARLERVLMANLLQKLIYRSGILCYYY